MGAYWFVPASIGLANALAERHHVMFITTPPGALQAGEQWQELLTPQVQVRVEPEIKLKNPFYYLQRALGLWKGIRQFQCDLLHLQERRDPYLIKLLLKKPQLPIVLTVHDPVPHTGDRLKHADSRGALAETLRLRADQIITHGEFNRQQLLKTQPGLDPDRVKVVLHGERGFFRKLTPPSSMERLNSMLFFGRINPYKGLGLLLEAWSIIRQKNPDARLSIAGRGHDLPNHMEKILSDDRIELIDSFIPASEMARLFTEASMVVLPYTEATQSGVLAVAVGFGKPVIATRVGSIPEMIDEGESGFVVPPNDPQALAEAALRIMSDEPLRRQMIEHIIHMREARLGWDALSMQTEQVYRAALQARRN